MSKTHKFILIALIVLVTIAIILVGVIVYIKKSDKTEKNNNQNIINNTNPQVDIDNVENKSNELAVKAFNAQFTSYEEERSKSAILKALFSTVKANNEIENNNHIVTFNPNGISQIEQLDPDKYYAVELFYDEEGYVYQILIKENNDITPSKDTESDMDKLIFNTKFTTYLGRINGEKLLELINVAQESNQEDEQHQVTVTSTNLDHIEDIVNENYYEITLNYDEETGYVNTVIIEAK